MEIIIYICEMIAKRIISLMSDKNLSSKQFAEELNISPSIVTHITSGRNNPSLDIILKIKTRFPDISLDWLLFGTTDSPIYSPTKEIEVKKEETKEPVEIKPINENRDLFSDFENPKKTTPNEVKKVILFYQNGKFEAFEP